MAEEGIVIGLDGGGTFTRALCSNLTGHVLAYAQTGGAHPRNPDAKENVRMAIHQVLAQANCEPEKVAGLVAGIAGVDPLKKDTAWAEDFTAIPGLTCERYHVNDAVVAHVGAFHFSPGIVAISGTGSIVWGITETGHHIRNYDFGHQSGVSAYWLGSNTIFRLLTSEISAAEAGLVERILRHLGVKDIAELRRLAAHSGWQDHGRHFQKYSSIAPLVTEAAREGVLLACSICDTAIAKLATGIRLVGSMFASHSISCVLIGGVAGSVYVRNGLMKVLAQNAGRRYKFIEPRLSPAAGAVLLALQRCNVMVDDTILETLSKQPRAAIA
jgi:glucosamine kinase